MQSSEVEQTWSVEDWRCAGYIVTWLSVIVVLAVVPGVGVTQVRFSLDPTAYCESLPARNLCSQTFITRKSDCMHAQSSLTYCLSQALEYMDRVNESCGETLGKHDACISDKQCKDTYREAKECVDAVQRPEWLLTPDIEE